ncbi:MAG: type I restriction endonuclease [Methylobacter sp.]|nr:MAG: type I restriction endonuclease [Methylobacter sp.]
MNVDTQMAVGRVSDSVTRQAVTESEADVGLRSANPNYKAKLLGEIVSFKTGKLDSNASENEGKYPFFTCSPITLRINNFAFDTEAVILAGNNANGVFSTKYYSGKFNAYQRTYVIEPLDLKEVSCRYIYFVISHMVNHLQELAIGTSTKFLTKTILNGLRIYLPPKIEQDQIAALLSSLDDRIALLRETNATLEAIAQALFKSWFVDFDPVYAKQQGREPEGMDADTAALFPDSFEESELGLVPRGWLPKRLDTFIELVYGKALKATDRILGEIPVYGSGGITGYHNKSLIDSPSIIVGRKGTVGTVFWEDLPFFPIDTVFYVRSDIPMTYCFYLLKTLGLHNMNTDAAVPGLNRNNVYRLIIPQPTEQVISAYHDVVSVMRDKIFCNNTQISTLTTLRDTLLPRLISGQLRLPDAEAMLEETT